MARPKSNTPVKGKLTLTVTDQTRAELQFVSEIEGKSISELVAEWGSKAARKAAKATGTKLPDVDQTSLL